MAVPGLFVGLATLDVVHHLDELPRRNEKVTAAAQFLAAGGPAANAAVTFAALGGAATLVTVLGGHAAVALISADLADHSVAVLDADPQRSQPPAVSAVRVAPDTGERSVSSADSAGPEPTAPDLTAVAETAEVVLLDGHWPALARAAANAARLGGVPVVLDAGRPRPAFDELIPQSDLVVASGDYLRDRPGLVDEAVRDGAAAVVTTHGDRPVRWATVAGRGEVDVPPLHAVDTHGAGDAFHGAVAYAVARLGWPTAVAVLPDILTFAVEVAAVRVTQAGPRGWLTDPRLAELAARWN
ncbi:MAG: PfkB family carbohydrate kinase [Jatrophihabitans sp.]